MTLRRRWRATVGAFAVALAGASAVVAQDAPRATDLVEEVEVNLVDIPVVVTDRKGNPVRDLTLDEFVVLEDGDRVELRYATPRFDVRPIVPPEDREGTGDGLPWTPGGAAPTLDREDALHLVLLVDALNLTPGHRNLVFSRLTSLLEESVDPAIPIMLVESGPRLVVHQPFTTNRDLVLREIERMTSGFAVGLFDPESQASQQGDLEFSLDLLRDCARNITCEVQPVVASTASEIRAYSLARVAQTDRVLANVRHLFSSLTFLPGRKAVLWISDGFPLNPGEDQFRQLQEVLRGEVSRLRSQVSGASFGAGPGAIDSNQAAQRAAIRLAQLESIASAYALENVTVNVEPQIRRVTEIANASGIRIYTLQAQGITSGADASRSASESNLADATTFRAFRAGNVRATLARMAEDTGGTFLQGSLQSERILDDIVRDAASYYLLGFLSPRAMDGEHHRLEVKIPGRRKLRIRHPEGYLGRTLQMQRAERTLASLYHGYGKNPASVWLELGYTMPEPPGDDERGVPVTLTLRVPVAALTFRDGDDGTPTADLSVFVAGKDRKGRVTNLVEFPIPVRIEAERLDEAREETLSIPLQVRARKGRNEIAVGVWTGEGAEPSFARTVYQPEIER